MIRREHGNSCYTAASYYLAKALFLCIIRGAGRKQKPSDRKHKPCRPEAKALPAGSKSPADREQKLCRRGPEGEQTGKHVVPFQGI